MPNPTDILSSSDDEFMEKLGNGTLIPDEEVTAVVETPAVEAPASGATDETSTAVETPAVVATPAVVEKPAVAVEAPAINPIEASAREIEETRLRDAGGKFVKKEAAATAPVVASTDTTKVVPAEGAATTATQATVATPAVDYKALYEVLHQEDAGPCATSEGAIDAGGQWASG
jgi:hypothetical protein